MRKLVFYMLLATLSSQVYSGWENTKGKVVSINNYAHTDTVLVKLSSPGVSVEACESKDYFAIDGNLPESRRNQMFTVLLAAKASDKEVTIAYDNTGNCIAYGNNPSVYRGILRIIH
ncbi:hypothetical protein QE250_06965 [Chromatiaceae bacterium AAb-1]|nr:hypothetical protein [Chromatiaceae bacterium AAb-1]